MKFAAAGAGMAGGMIGGMMGGAEGAMLGAAVGVGGTFIAMTWNSDLSVMKGRIEQDLSKGRCDVMQIHQFMSNQVIKNYGKISVETFADPSDVTLNLEPSAGLGARFLALLDTNNMQMLNKEEMTALNEELRWGPTLIIDDEVIEVAFKKKADLMLFTNYRMLYIDRDRKGLWGIGGTKWSYSSTPWDAINAYTFKMAGEWLDADSEMFLYQDFNYSSELQFDLKKGCIDQTKVNRYLDARCSQQKSADISFGSQKRGPSQVRE